ncbi:tRNA (N(6)-L-threonylcarbamoyladenosine(37)-C(2))-methylthiotransferase MtaB [SAR202 cluster bacterium AC-409-J13_OGT_754m]|nr:tRNA (N(6)-L-threonylcarbamoyladenosine(37)-C(2))-methylthiotransferase MtaB [SAR202 cluster bacterium AC-409-J13_OGT_754m]
MNKFRGTIAVDTHGCKLNRADSDDLIRNFINAGYRVVQPSEGPNIYVLNTCTVTHVADAKARQALRGVKKANPNTKIIVTGCYAERAPKDLLSIHGVDLVWGNNEKINLVDKVVSDDDSGEGKEQIFDRGAGTPLFTSINGRTRAMLKIQEGCNQVCSYCIVPKVRGRETSVEPRDLINQVRKRVSEGYKEVVLTGTQLGSYGFEMDGMNIELLIKSILNETNVERLRVSSLQPQEITDKLLNLWRASRLCPHFHMPLQSGSNTVLERMRRRYTIELYRQVLLNIRNTITAASVTADVIVGFPGETDEEFEETFNACSSLDLSDIHVFPYSTRPGTTASHFRSHIDSKTKKIRMNRMLDLSKIKSEAFRRSCLGSVHSVLWEKEERPGSGYYLGLTDNYIKVRTRSSRNLVNHILPCKLVGLQNKFVFAEPV